MWEKKGKDPGKWKKADFWGKFPPDIRHKYFGKIAWKRWKNEKRAVGSNWLKLLEVVIDFEKKQSYMYTYIYIYVYIHMYIYIFICIHTYIYICIHYIHTYIHTYTHVYMYI